MSRNALLVGLCLCVAAMLTVMFAPIDSLWFKRSDVPLVLPDGELPQKKIVIALLEEERFDDLETVYSLTLAGNEESATDTLHRFRAFEYADPALQEHLDEWVSAQGSSPLPYLARGGYFLHLAYVVRGHEVSSKTSVDQFKQMRAFLEKAGRDFQHALDVGPPSVAAYQGLIGIAITNGKRRQAFQTLNIALASTDNPLPLHATYMRSQWPQWGGAKGDLWNYWVRLRSSGTLRESERYLDYMTAVISAEDAEISGDQKAALAYYEEAVELDDSQKGMIEHARTLARLDRLEEAIEVLDAGLEREPDSARHHLFKAGFLWGLNRQVEAVAAIQQALKFDPYNPDILMMSYDFSKVLRQQSERKVDLASKEIHQLQGNRDLEKAMFYGALRGDVQIQWGRYLLGEGRPREEAYSAFERAQELAPNEPEYVLTYAISLSANDDCRALKEIRRFESMCRTGADCSRFISVENLKKNLEWCKDSPDQRPPERNDRLISNLTSCKPNYNETAQDVARSQCLRMAKAGDAGAAFDMAVIYIAGYGVDSNYDSAVHWLTEAVNQGHLEAKHTLGFLIYRGWGSEVDPKRGRSLIEEAANAGSTNAMVSLGSLYYQGLANDRNLELSLRWYSQAAELGNESAQIALHRSFGDQEYKNVKRQPPG